MKIAIIVRRLNIKGGTQRQALCLANELQSRNHEVKVYTFFYSKEKCYPELLRNLDVISLDPTIRRFYHNRFVDYLTLFFYENRLAKQLTLLIDKKTEILNPHDQVSYRVAAYFKKIIKDIPSVWMMNDLPLNRWIYDRERTLRPGFKQPLVKRVFYFLRDWYEKRVFLSKQDKIIVLDKKNKERVKKYLGMESVVIRSGLDLDKFNHQVKELKEPINLLATGIFFIHRRFEDIITALNILVEKGYNANLSIVGNQESDRKYYQSLITLVNELNLKERVFFLGTVTDERLTELYQEKDIFIFPNYLQTWGLAVFEAMACGTPVVVSKSTGAAEVLTSYENAILVNPKKPEEIALAIEKVYLDSDLYAKLSTKGRDFVRKNISWSRYADNMLKIFEII